MTDSESSQDSYAKNLRQTFGYPLRYPEPKPGLPVSYAENGLHIGDVGYVDEDGMFIVQFNICFPLDHDLHQAMRKDLVDLVGLTKFDANEVSPIPNAFPPHRVICHGVQTLSPAGDLKRTRMFMPCSKTGAILALPSGALRQKLNKKQEQEFRELAEKHALSWCQITGCASLYLITGFYKTSSWYLASFCGARPAGQALLECDNAGGYTWDPTCDYRQSPGENHHQNQTVLVLGFKIQVREWDSHIWVEELPSHSSVWSKLAFLASSILHILVLSWEWIASGNAFKLRKHDTPQDVDGGVRVSRVPALSQPFHPSDVINRYLLRKNSNAQVAITHDDQWLAMLTENEISHEDMMVDGHFWEFLEETYGGDPDFVEVAYLRKKNENGSDSYKSPSLGIFSFPPVLDDARWLVISYMRVENFVTSLGRTPVGFYVLVQFNGIKRYSQCKPVLFSDGPLDSVIEWDDKIMLPTDSAVEIELSIHASFEFEPLLGNGIVLHTIKGSVGSLAHVGSAYFVWCGGCTSSCASLLITFEEHQVSPLFGRSHDNRNSGGDDHELCVEVAEVTDQGHDALLRFHRYQETEELGECIKYYRLALDRCPIDHKFYAVALFNFATAKFISCQVHGAISDLDAAIVSYRRVLWFRSPAHPDRPATLLHLAQALLYRQGKVQREALVVDEIKKLVTEIQQICSRDSNDYRGAILILQTLRRYQISISGKPAELDELISELAWSARVPSSRFDRPYRLVNLSLALRKRFETTGYLDDLENSISVLEEARQFVSNGHLLRPWILASLGDAFGIRFVRRGVTADLDNAIAMIENAVEATPDNHFDKPWMRASLGNALRIRFTCHGVVSDLEEAVSMIENAVKATPDDHFNKPWILTSLGNTLRVRFVRHGVTADLYSAIVMIKDAVDATTEDHLDKPWMLTSLGNALRMRFVRCGAVADLDNAIAIVKDAVKTIPNNHFDKPWFLTSLSDLFCVHFVRGGTVADFDEAISMIKDTLRLIPDDHFHKPCMLASLGNALRVRFVRHGVVADLDNAVTMIEDAVKLVPDGRFNKPWIRASLGEALCIRFVQGGIITDFDNAISMIGEAAKLVPNGHFDKSWMLTSFGNALRVRFILYGVAADLDNTISMIKDAEKLVPDDHFDKPWILASLGDALRVRSTQLKHNVPDFHIAIPTNAAKLVPNGHHDKSWMLISLGEALRMCSAQRSVAVDLDIVVLMIESAVTAISKDDLDMPWMVASLRDVLRIRSLQHGIDPYLDGVTRTAEDAAKLVPHGHLDRSWILTSLCDALCVRFAWHGISADLHSAISMARASLEMTPGDYFDRPWMLASLGNAIHTRYFKRRPRPRRRDAVMKL